MTIKLERAMLTFINFLLRMFLHMSLQDVFTIKTTRKKKKKKKKKKNKKITKSNLFKTKTMESAYCNW